MTFWGLFFTLLLRSLQYPEYWQPFLQAISFSWTFILLPSAWEWYYFANRISNVKLHLIVFFRWMGTLRIGDSGSGYIQQWDLSKCLGASNYRVASFTKMPAAPIPLPTHILVHSNLPFVLLSWARPVTTCLTPASHAASIFCAGKKSRANLLIARGWEIAIAPPLCLLSTACNDTINLPCLLGIYLLDRYI